MRASVTVSRGFESAFEILLLAAVFTAAAESPAPPLLVSTQQNFTFFVCAGNRNGTTLIVSDGAGAGLYHPPDQGGFNHYVAFTVAGTNVSFQVVKLTK